MATITDTPPAPLTVSVPHRTQIRAWMARLVAQPAVRAGATAWLTSRVVYVFLTFAVGLAPAAHPISHTGYSIVDIAQVWGFWDTSKWLHIAAHGYDAPNLPAFFPLMALFDWVGTHLLPWISPVFVALLIGNLATLIAFVALADLAGTQARALLRLYTAYPFAIFLASGYSDTLACAAIFVALVSARRHWYPVAFVAAFAAALARPTAICLIIPLILCVLEGARLAWAWSWWRAWWRSWRSTLPQVGIPLIALALAVPLGLAAYVVYCAVALGNPWAFFAAQSTYGRTGFARLGGIVLMAQAWAAFPFLSEAHWRQALDLVPLIVALVATPLVWRRLGAAWGAYCAVIVSQIILTPIQVPPLTTPIPYISAGRYLLLAFPIPVLALPWLARHADIERWIITAGWMIQAVLLHLLFHAGWIV